MPTHQTRRDLIVVKVGNQKSNVSFWYWLQNMMFYNLVFICYVYGIIISFVYVVVFFILWFYTFILWRYWATSRGRLFLKKKNLIKVMLNLVNLSSSSNSSRWLWVSGGNWEWVMEECQGNVIPIIYGYLRG